jgi:5-methylcytosine-specific restriction endonuclease McrA
MCGFKKSAVRHFRDSIFDAWERRCAYCGRDGADTLDHIRPKSKGGPFTAYNLVPACRRCNQNKSAEPPLEWFRRQSFYSAEKEAKIVAWICDHHRPLIPSDSPGGFGFFGG